MIAGLDAEPGWSKSKFGHSPDDSRPHHHNSTHEPSNPSKTLPGNPPNAAVRSTFKSSVVGSSLTTGQLRKRDHATAFTWNHDQDVAISTELHTSHSPESDKRDNMEQKTNLDTTVQQPWLRQFSKTHGPAITNPPSSDFLVKGVSEGSNISRSRQRRRLIDTLAAQRTLLAEDANFDESESLKVWGGEGHLTNVHTNFSMPDVRTRAVDRRGTTPSNRKVRFTYSQSRRIVNESQTTDVFESAGRGIEDGLDPVLSEPLAMPIPPTDAFVLDESDAQENNAQPAIKSVHELRRAGAKNRFADEMDDLISRISLPSKDSSLMRRNALCELVQKLQRKEFMAQFRDHTSRDRVAQGVGKEDDLICGFALVSALLSFLTSSPAPNLLRQLACDGIGKLLAILLRVGDDIVTVASQKSLNISCVSRSSVGAVKAILQGLPIWHGYRPAVISPRTVSLQLMALLSRSVDAGLLDQILLDSQEDIISVATWASEEGSYSEVDYALTVFTLETQSSAGVAPRLNGDGGHPARIARLLSRAFLQWPSGRAELDSAILKLALNTTNTEVEAAAFGDPELSTRLACSIGDLFTDVQGAIVAGKLKSEKYDELLLMLGVMINIMEYCPSARSMVDAEAIDDLIRLWQENQQFVGEADSVEKSKLSVVIGYLSLLLGYMCLSDQVRKQLEHYLGPGGLQTLRGSIQQFATMYKAVDSKAYSLDTLLDELWQLG